MRKFAILLSIVLILIVFLSGCSRRIYRVAYPTLTDGKYDSEFPYKNSSAELLKTSKTIRKLTSIAYYRSYVFSEENPATPLDIKLDAFKQKTVAENVYSNSVIGTAVVIYFSGNKVVLLTCAHVVDFPDTVITYFRDSQSGRTNFIQSVAFKQRQSDFVAEFPERGELEILAMDKGSDLALLGKSFSPSTPVFIPVFEYPFGNAKELEWGSFVYLLGFPKGYQMITKGIVSQPNRNKKGGFIVDALFNQGFSGGVVLAIRDGVPNFELVGIATSVSADFDYTLNPPKDISSTGYDPRIPYQGDIFINLKKHINYGITFIISSDEVLRFIKKKSEELLKKGYDLHFLYKNQPAEEMIPVK